MVNQLEKIMKRRRTDFVERNRPEIDDDVTINMSNCSGASSMSTVPPSRIIVHEAAHAIPKWRRRRDNRGRRRSARARRIHDELMCFEEAACYNERWIRENPRHDTTKLRGGIPHVSRGNAWQTIVMANNLASLPEADTIFDVKRATRAVDMAISDSGATAHFYWKTQQW